MKTRIEVLPLAELRAQELNARFMKGETFRTLVANIARDGSLTSVPLVRQLDDGTYKILSGHHRTKAAIEAGIGAAECMIIDEPITRQQEVALVLSHNALSGEDDPSTLRALYDELEDPDWRWYAGLDDRTLAMLDEVSTEGLSEANLEFSTINLVFLPNEHEAAKEALAEARKRAGIAETWLAGHDQYEHVLSALESTTGAYSIGNVATALGIILTVFENHITDLDEGWVDEKHAPKGKKPVPMETVFGSRFVPAKSAVRIRQAIKVAEEAGDLVDQGPWEFIELLASTYLLSAQAEATFGNTPPSDE